MSAEIIFQPAYQNKYIQEKCPAATCKPVSLSWFVLHFNFGSDLRIGSLFEKTAGATGKKERADGDMEWRRLRKMKGENKHRGGFRQKVSQFMQLRFMGEENIK